MNQKIQDLGNEASEELPQLGQRYLKFRDVQSSNDDLLGEVNADYFLLAEGIADSSLLHHLLVTDSSFLLTQVESLACVLRLA
jgi:hypothetical protein